MQKKILRTYYSLPKTPELRCTRAIEFMYGIGTRAIGGKKVTVIKNGEQFSYQVEATPKGRKRAAAIAALIGSIVLTLGILPLAVTLLHYKLSKKHFAAHRLHDEVSQNRQTLFADILRINQVRGEGGSEHITPAEIARQVNQQASQQQIETTVSRPELAILRKRLACILDDIEWTDKIMYQYATTLRCQIPEEQRPAFESWLLDAAYFLGSRCFDHNLFFEQTNSKVKPLKENRAFRIAFARFVSNIQEHTSPRRNVVSTADRTRKIAVLYLGAGGGGHKAPAFAMASHLRENGHDVKLIDLSEYRDRYDPKVDGMGHDEIYTRIFQQQGNRRLANRMWHQAEKMHALDQRLAMRDLVNDLREFEADQLLIAAHHLPAYSNLAYRLGVPATYVHTDHEFNKQLKQLAIHQQQIQTPLVTFGALSKNAGFFHHLCKSTPTSYRRLPESLRRQMVPLNFPVRKRFQRVTKAEKASLRQELSIDDNAIVVKVAMGANGIPKDIKQMIKRISDNANSSRKPLHVLIVCGTNTALKEDLDRSLQNRANVTFQVLGFLDEKQMSDFDKASDVWITKPGGSTTAEAEIMRKQMIYIPTKNHPWELKNALHLERKNLAQKIGMGNLVRQILKRAEIGETVEYSDSQDEPWTEQLEQIIEQRATPLLETA